MNTQACRHCTVPMNSLVRYLGRDRSNHPANGSDTFCIICEEILGSKEFKDDAARSLYCINVLYDSDFYVIRSHENRRGPQRKMFLRCKVCEAKIFGTDSKIYCSDKCRSAAHSTEELRRENQELRDKVVSLESDNMDLRLDLEKLFGL